MSRKKHTLETRPRNVFRTALAEAKKRYDIALKERAAYLKKLSALNIEIPNLERTVRALESQLGGTGAVSPLTSQTGSRKVGEVPLLAMPKIPDEVFDSLKRAKQAAEDLTGANEIPPEIRAQLPPEDFSKFGSHFGDGPPEKEDFLPEIDGKEVIPEEKKS